MATITQRNGKNGKISFQAKVRIKGFPLYIETFSRLTDAKRWSAKTETEIHDGRLLRTSESQKHTLAETIDRYITEVLPEKKTAKDQLRQLNHWKKKLGHLTLRNVTPAILVEERQAITNVATARGEQRSNATVARYLASLSHVFTVAVKEWQWLDANPLLQVRKPKLPRGRIRYLSDNERDRLLNACKDSGHPFLYTAVVLSLSTGARSGELMNLKWPDVNLSEGKITLYETKNGDIRPLPLQGHALNLMKDLFSNRNIGTEWVFPGKTKKKSGKMGPIDLRSPWLKALKAAAIEDFRWHDLRHSAASYLAMNGATLPEIAAILGHKQLSMVQRYAHLSPQHTAGVVASMNEKIFGCLPNPSP